MSGLVHELRSAFRSLAHAPGFAAVSVFTLALGIGANTAIFSAVDGVLLRPAPVAGLDRLVMVWETDRDSGTTREPASVPDYLDFVERSRSFDALAGMVAGDVTMSREGGEPQRLAALRASRNLLPMLGIAPVAGRGFTAEEDRPGGPAAALISEALWRRAFAASPEAIGRPIRIDERPATIVGVLPDEADFGVLQVLSSAAYARGFADRGGRSRVDVWLPLQPDPETLPRDTHPLLVVGRLSQGSTVESAQQEMASIAADLERAYPSNAARGVHVEPLDRVVFGPVRPAFFVLLGSVGLVLLITCVNVTTLLLGRGAGRGREVAIRAALGAGGLQLAKQFIVESAVLTAAAAAAGVALAYAGLGAILAIAPPDIPRLEAVAIDGRVLAATAAVALAVTFLLGLVPVLQARRVDVQAALGRAGGPQGSPGRADRRVNAALVVAEVALAAILVAGAGLLARSFWSLQRVDPGFTADGILKAEFSLPATRYPVDFRLWPDFREMHAFNAAVLQRLWSLPGVASAAIAGNHPLDRGFTNSFTIAGREAESRSWPEISLRRVTPDYFRTVGLALARGRLLSEGDATSAPPVALLNRAAAERFFRGREALGAKIVFWGAARTIVGIVENEKFHGLAEPSPLAAYVPLAQAPPADGAGAVLVRTPGDPMALLADVRRAIAQVDPGVAVFGAEPLRETVGRSVSRERFTLLLLGSFAGAAILLAAAGIYGVLSYSVARRTRELGIRLALGERPSRAVGRVLEEALALTAAGVAVGLAGAVALGRALESLLFGVTARDPLAFAAAPLVLAGVALLAAYAPARRAVRVDPVRALKSE